MNGFLKDLPNLLREVHRDELFIGSAGVTVLIGALRHLGFGQGLVRNRNAPASIRRVTGWIDEHISMKITLPALAAVAGCSTFHLIRLFKLYLGMSPAKYVMEHRLQRSRELLREPASDLAEVALRCGFANQCHFTRTFTRRFGEPPGLYRSKHRSIHVDLWRNR